MKKKILATLLALVLILGSVPVLSMTAFAETDEIVYPTGNIDGGYAGGTSNIIEPAEEIVGVIDTYQELALAILNAQEGDVIELGGDIDFGGMSLNNANFGILKDGVVIDGNGYAIKNCICYWWRGRSLFLVAENAHVIVKNLNIGTADSKIIVGWDENSSDTNRNSGILFGDAQYGKSTFAYSFDIENVNAYVSIKAIKAFADAAGTLVGNAYLKDNSVSNITNCHVYGEIFDDNTNTGTNFVGGLIGRVKNGNGATLNIQNCTNNINVTGGKNVGGLIGFVEGDCYATININKCVNNGAVTGDGWGIGGLIGQIVPTTVTEGKTNLTVNISNSINMGDVKSSAKCNVAGIIGNIEASGVTTGAKISISNCINIADITAGNGSNATAIVRDGATYSTDATLNAGVTVTNCTSVGTVTGNDAVTVDDNITKYTAITDDNKAEITAKLNSLAIGYYTIGTDGTISMDTARPQFVGIQRPAGYKAGDTTLDIRFLAVLQEEDLNSYTKVGFKLDGTATAVGADGTTVLLNDTIADAYKDISTTSVYTSVNGADENGNTVKYTAAGLGGDHIIALHISDVPALVLDTTTAENTADTANVTVTLTITPYALDAEGNELLGTSWQIVIVAGGEPTCTLK